MSNYVSEKNMKSWDNGAIRYSESVHSPKALERILSNPKSAFHHTVWEVISQTVPDFHGLRVCVPSSGDNHAVFAFAMLGAEVLSCDISEKQLENAQKVSSAFEWGNRIQYLKADTMQLDGVPDGTFDFVYTSNGVHVWIDQLNNMYKNIFRVLKKDGIYMMYEIHPYTRPFDDDLKVIKPYDQTGPFEDNDEINFHWRLMDIMNAITSSGLSIRHVEEMSPEKNYDWPFWLSLDEYLSGVRVPPEEVDRMYDWKESPAMALPCWLSITATK